MIRTSLPGMAHAVCFRSLDRAFPPPPSSATNPSTMDLVSPLRHFSEPLPARKERMTFRSFPIKGYRSTHVRGREGEREDRRQSGKLFCSALWRDDMKTGHRMHPPLSSEVRGTSNLKRYNIHNSETFWKISSCHASYESY